MKHLKCPACSRRIGFWTFAKAITPNHLKCAGCHKTLRFDNTHVIWCWIFLIGLATGSTGYFLGMTNFLYLLIFTATTSEVLFFVIASQRGFKIEVKDV